MFDMFSNVQQPRRQQHVSTEKPTGVQHRGVVTKRDDTPMHALACGTGRRACIGNFTVQGDHESGRWA